MRAVIDLRSDTVTLPTGRMREAMQAAALGDDSLEGDPTVQALEKRAAALCGKEAGLFVASGTMGNLVAGLAYAAPGGRVLLDPLAHIAMSESGGLTRLAGLTGVALPADGPEMDLDRVRDEVRRASAAHPVAMAVVETTHNHSGGRVPSLSYMRELQALCRPAGIPVHVDGARVFNAAAALGVEASAIAALGDSLTFCLSKALSAPMGSVLVGPQPFVDRAREFRRMVGGGLRQAGVVAAAGLVALDEMIERLPEDHRRAYRLWKFLRDNIPQVVRGEAPQSNIVMLEVGALSEGRNAAYWVDRLSKAGVLARARGAQTIRLVTHRHILDDDVARAGDILAACLAG